MKILIKVTKEVLERSKGCKADHTATTNCAIALAVRDLFPTAQVECDSIELIADAEYSNADNYCSLPQEAQDFIDQFDEADPFTRENMDPFSFEIEVPEFVIQQIGLSQIYKVLSESKTLEHVNP